MPIKNEVLGIPKVVQLKQSFAVSEFTDGGAAIGTVQFRNAIPAGAVMVGSKIGPIVGFAGNTSATIQVGDGTTVARYMTGTPSVFTTEAVGVESGVPSGNKLLTAANRPTITVTTATDFTLAVTNGSGRVTVSLFYIKTQ